MLGEQSSLGMSGLYNLGIIYSRLYLAGVLGPWDKDGNHEALFRFRLFELKETFTVTRGILSFQHLFVMINLGS